MQVILVHDIEKLGRAGDIVKVAPGYARNYLLPKKIAYEATTRNLRWIEQQKEKILAEAARRRTDAESVAERINAVSVTVAKRAGEEDKIYGSVTTQELAEKLLEHGIEVDRRKIVLAEPIKRLGEHEVHVKLHADVTAVFKVTVVRAGEEETDSEQS